MKTLTLISALGATLIAGPGPLQGQSAADSATINRILDSARALKLPDAPLRSVLNEGRARNESPARIANALRTYVDVLFRARTALGPGALDSEIDAGASVLLSGASVRTLGAVRTARPTGDVTVALVVLADLVDRGVPHTRAEDAVVTLARVGATDAALHAFRTGVQQDLAAGQGAESSLLKRTRETVSRLQIAIPRKQPPLELRGAHVVSAPQWGAPERESTALLAPHTGEQGSLWAVSARATPIARLPALQLRGAAAGAFERATEPGQTSGELIATLGVRREHAGAELGSGAAAYSGLAPRLPLAYGAAWYERGATRLRLEVRAAHSDGWRREMDEVNQRRIGNPFTSVDSSVRTGGLGEGSDTLSQGPRPGQPGTLSELRVGLAQGFGRLGLETTTGVRFLDATPFDAWNFVGVSTRLKGRVGIVGGVASRFAILDRTIPSGSFGYLGFRLLPRVVEPISTTAPRAAGAHRALPRARIHTSRGQSHFEIDAPGATRIEVAGDFTEWNALDMTKVSPSRWRLTIPTAWQMIRVRVRVDGAEWVVPDGVARARTVFGDDVGVVALAAGSGS